MLMVLMDNRRISAVERQKEKAAVLQRKVEVCT